MSLVAKADKKKRRSQRLDRKRRNEIKRQVHGQPENGTDSKTDLHVERQIESISELVQKGLMDQAASQAENLAILKTDCWKTWNLLGTIQANLKKLDQAENSFRQVTKLNPGHAPAWQYLGRILASKSLTQQAEKCFEKAQSLGEVLQLPIDVARNCLIEGKLEEAIVQAKIALQRSPDSVDARNIMGLVLQQQGNHHDAALMFTSACEIDSTFADGFANLGESLRNLGDSETAEQMLNHALHLDPKHSNAMGFLGLLKTAMGKREESIALFEKALEINPRYSVFRMQLAKNYIHFDKLDRSLQLLQYLVKNNINTLEALSEISGVHSVVTNRPELVQTCQAIRSIHPENTIGRVRPVLSVPQVVDDWDEIYKIRQRVESGLDELLGQNFPKIHKPLDDFPNSLFYLTYHGLCCKEVNRKLSSLFRKISPEINYQNPKLSDLKRLQHPGSKIKVAFLSKNFNNHTIGRLTLGMLEKMDRSRFEVQCFTFPAEEDHFRKQFRQFSDHFEVLPPDRKGSCERISECSPDILYYPDIGMDPVTYQLAHARLAPIQCVTFGHPVTTGISTIDHFLSYEHIEPEGAQQHYTEKLSVLENFSFYYRRPTSLSNEMGKDLLGFGNDFRLYLCPQTLYKFHPDLDTIFGDILRQDPKGILILLKLGSEHWRRQLMARFEKTIPDVANRIKWLPRQSALNFLHLYQIGDVALDPVHFGSGNTAMEGISMGTPIVTMPDHFMRSRFTYACYKRLGMDDLVASNNQQYVDKAVEVACNLDLRQHLKQEFTRRSDVLFENPAGVRELENWFQAAVEEHWSQ